MPRCFALLFSLWCLLPAPTPALGADGRGADADLQLTLPPALWAVPNVETGLFFDNVVLSQTPEQYQFRVACELGHSTDRGWFVTPTPADAGTHNLELSVHSSDGKLLAKQTTVLHVVSASAGAARAGTDDGTLRILIIGDSLTNASAYPNEIARLLSLPGNPTWKMLGTHKPASAADGVAHEGYGGWTWERFVNHYEPMPDPKARKWSSPFLFPGDDGNPELNLSRYFDESCQGQRPDYVIIMLGINDCFSAPPDEITAIDGRIDAMFKHAEQLLTALQEAAPDAQIGLCLTTPPNSRQEAFEANYADRYTRWGWKRIQHRLVQRQLKHVASKNDSKISVIPTELYLDPIDGYPANNGVHPNVDGYRQIGAAIYAWLKGRMALEASP